MLTLQQWKIATRQAPTTKIRREERKSFNFQKQVLLHLRDLGITIMSHANPIKVTTLDMAVVVVGVREAEVPQREVISATTVKETSTITATKGPPAASVAVVERCISTDMHKLRD